MSIDQAKFDIDVVIVADQAFDPYANPDSHKIPSCYMRKKDEVNLAPFERQNWTSMFSPLEMCSREGIAGFTSAHGKEITDIMLDGRVRISILINSPGGLGAKVSLLQNVFKNMLRRNGRVYTYATSEAISAAASLFMEGEERNLLENTELLFHLSMRLVMSEKEIRDIEKTTHGDKNLESRVRETMQNNKKEAGDTFCELKEFIISRAKKK